tara:strand:+ start:3496 stop:3714 length:219 start_codon:yes stop_codon:yes gene_type:complete
MNTTLELYVPGMHCGGCASKVEAALVKCDGVQSVTTDLSHKSVRIAGQMLEPEQLIAALNDSGYDARDAATN